MLDITHGRSWPSQAVGIQDESSLKSSLHSLHVMGSLGHVLNHQFAHFIHVLLTRGHGDLAVNLGVGFTKPPVLNRRSAIAEDNQLANHFVDEFTNEPQE